jgi:RNA-directed DNA polymerase
MVTRTTMTRTTSAVSAQSADLSAACHTPFSLSDLLQAYYDCRKHKRNTNTALAFEINLERNIVQLRDDLLNGSYAPGQSICFVVTRPKAREVWAADFRDRIVHHLLYNHISERFQKSFIADSCACIPGRGTLYAGKRLESKIRSITQDWSVPAFYLKCDLANFFVSIDKNALLAQLKEKIHEPWWLKLATQVLMHDPRTNYVLHSSPSLVRLVPPHKQLTNQAVHLGLPIGNLSSQFFANIYLNGLDQFAKHTLKVPHYIRYVDDFILLHESPKQLGIWLSEINEFLPSLGARLNPKKTIIQPIDRGVDFVGHVIKPFRRTTRKKTVNQAIKRIETIDHSKLWETANSYFGLLGQASHSREDRANLARAVLLRGQPVNMDLTKTYKPRKVQCSSKI